MPNPAPVAAPLTRRVTFFETTAGGCASAARVDRVDVVFHEGLVDGDERELLDLGLGHQHPIERIAVVAAVLVAAGFAEPEITTYTAADESHTLLRA